MRAARSLVLTLLLSTPMAAWAEMKFFVDNKEVAFNTTGATEVYLQVFQSDLKNACAGYEMMEGSVADLAAVTEFPLANNSGPAKDFVAGFMELSHWGRNFGYAPNAFPLIWANMTADKDKAFDKTERDNAVALWIATRDAMPLNCKGN